MACKLIRHRLFVRDVKRIKRSGWDLEPLRTFLKCLQEREIPERYGLHKLKGALDGVLDVHIRHDWIVFFRYTNNGDIELLRTGTHAMLGIG